MKKSIHGSSHLNIKIRNNKQRNFVTNYVKSPTHYPDASAQKLAHQADTKSVLLSQQCNYFYLPLATFIMLL